MSFLRSPWRPNNIAHINLSGGAGLVGWCPVAAIITAGINRNGCGTGWGWATQRPRVFWVDFCAACQRAPVGVIPVELDCRRLTAQKPRSSAKCGLTGCTHISCEACRIFGTIFVQVLFQSSAFP